MNYTGKIMAAVFAVSFLFLGFQNCSQQKFSGGDKTKNNSLGGDSQQLNYGDTSDYGVNGQLDSMDDNGVIEGTVHDPNQPDSGVPVDFYVVNPDGGLTQIGQVIAYPSDDDLDDPNSPYVFNFQVPSSVEIDGNDTNIICRPIVAYADIDGSATELPMGPNFHLWGDQGACSSSSLPPMIDLISPSTPKISTGSKQVAITGRCQPGAGPVIVTGEIKKTVKADCSPEGIFMVTVTIMHPQQEHTINITQTNSDGESDQDMIEAFLDQELPPPPTPPVTGSGPGGSGYGGGSN